MEREGLSDWSVATLRNLNGIMETEYLSLECTICLSDVTFKKEKLEPTKRIMILFRVLG